MRKLAAGLFSVVFLLGLASPANAAEAKQETKTLSGFGVSTKLSTSHKAQLKKLVNSNSSATEATCVGYRLKSTSASEVRKIQSRAKAACDYSKQILPNLATQVSLKLSSSKTMAGRVQVTLVTPAGPIESIDLKSYDPAVVSETALAKVNEYLASAAGQAKITYTLKAGKNVSADQIAKEKERIEKSTLFWAAIYSGSPTVFVYSGADVDWMVGELNALGNFFHDNLIRNDHWKRTGECMQSLAVADNKNHYYINCQRPNYKDNRMSIIAAHEFAHLPITTKFNNQPGGRMTRTPTWVNEGGSEFFGLNLTDQGISAGFDYWHKVHINANGKLTLSSRASEQNLRQLLAGITESESVELMNLMENASALQSDMPYSTGKWAVELLVASGGVEKFFEFLNGINASTDWKTSFQNAYGISITDFYKLMAPYLKYLGTTY